MNQSNTTVAELTHENHRSILGRQGIVLVECWASHCGACKMLAPVYSKVSERYPQHTFAKLDTMAEKKLSSILEIVHVPTLLLYRDGNLLFKQAGNFDEARLDDVISQAEALDMDAVRADIASESSETSRDQRDCP
jgi:thioredoxin 1